MSWTKGGIRKPEPDPPSKPLTYDGPKGPTLCAEDSYYDGRHGNLAPCPRCGHYAYGGHQHNPCDACRFEIRLQALEAQR